MKKTTIAIFVLFMALTYGLVWKIADGLYLDSYADCWRDRNMMVFDEKIPVEFLNIVDESCNDIRNRWHNAPIFINPWNRS